MIQQFMNMMPMLSNLNPSVPPISSTNTSAPVTEVFEPTDSQIDKVTEMGFLDRTMVKDVLTKHRGNISQAVEDLLTTLGD